MSVLPAWMECSDLACRHPECLEEREIMAMNDQQLTLFLARAGVSPEDNRKSFERCVAKLPGWDEVKE